MTESSMKTVSLESLEAAKRVAAEMDLPDAMNLPRAKASSRSKGFLGMKFAVGAVCLAVLGAGLTVQATVVQESHPLDWLPAQVLIADDGIPLASTGEEPDLVCGTLAQYRNGDAIDLVAVVAEDGKQGFVYSSELKQIEPSLASADAAPSRLAVYRADGATQIGEYVPDPEALLYRR